MTLLRLKARCPRCGSRPAIRITCRERELHRNEPPDQLAKTYQCRCGEVYDITAQAYHDAEGTAA